MSPEQQLVRLAALIAESPHNLVSRGDRPRVASAHVPEAVALADLLGAQAGARWMDLGTGGGLPGLALAVVRPDVRWTLLDATAKKVRAVADFAGQLGLDNVTVACARAEEAGRDPAHRGRYDGVVARAVAPLQVLTELARGFVDDGGLLAAVKGPAWDTELADAAHAMRVLDWQLVDTQRVTSAVRPTWLVRMRTTGEPPKGYPRTTGLPRSAPLRSR
jgi:16S rRNA (guanine527-N7)-methyltransferase